MVIGAELLAGGHPAIAQAPADSLRTQHRLLLKAGLNLPHFYYSPEVRRRVVVPLALGAEYRLTPRFSLYGQAEAYLPTGRATGTRLQRAAFPAAAGRLSVGLRSYYHHGPPGAPPLGNSYGGYLALEGDADIQDVAAPRGRRGRVAPLRLTPGLFALWGVQRRWGLRPLLYDLSAGLGVQGPARYIHYERPATHAWAVATQVNLRIYFHH